jgi:adenylate kinase
VLDGFPRTLRQAAELDVFLAPRPESLRAVLLEVDAEELERRVGERRECRACSWTGSRSEAGSGRRCPRCGGPIAERADDALANFRKRLGAFAELTGPVVDYYEPSGRLRRVNGRGSPEEVFRRLLEALREA